MIEVTIVNESEEEIPLSDEEVRSAISQALETAEIDGDVSCSFVLISDEKIRDLNKQYRKKDKATNVLSFPVNGDSGDIGDIFMSPKYIEREAAELGVSLRKHYAMLLIHGTLHLVGYDHEEDADFEEMNALEKKAMERLNKKLDL